MDIALSRFHTQNLLYLLVQHSHEKQIEKTNIIITPIHKIDIPFVVTRNIEKIDIYSCDQSLRVDFLLIPSCNPSIPYLT